MHQQDPTASWSSEFTTETSDEMLEHFIFRSGDRLLVDVLAEEEKQPGTQNDSLSLELSAQIERQQPVIDLRKYFTKWTKITKFPQGKLLEGKTFIKSLNVSYWPPNCPFSEEIFELTELEELCISVYPFQEISHKLGNLLNLRRLLMRDSKIERFPTSIGKLKNLKIFDVYRSYSLHYLPFEVKRCPLNDTRMSTRALYVNSKNSLLLPPLPPFPLDTIHQREILSSILHPFTGDIDDIVNIILRFCDSFNCSAMECGKTCVGEPLYIWSWEHVGTDRVALLATMCSRDCVASVPNSLRVFYCSAGRNLAGDGRYVQHFDSQSCLPRKLEAQVNGSEVSVEKFWRKDLGKVFRSYSFRKSEEFMGVEINVIFNKK